MSKQKVLVTIDTEGPAGTSPVDTLIFGKNSSGKEYGIRYLMSLFDEYNVKGLFFVDFAEAWDYGEDKIEAVIRCIAEQGHNIGVHLHPDHMLDSNRRYLWQYNYDEQYDMISKCTSLYEKIVGKKPLSFRAGRYSANDDTLKILVQLGYCYDMSMFFGNKYCKINPQLCCNRTVHINDSSMIEIPVTSFRSFKSPFYSRFDKIDSAMDFSEFKRVMQIICETGKVDIVSLFVHSFSLLDWRKNPDKPKLSKVLQRKLIKQLEWVYKSKDAIFIDENKLREIETLKTSPDVELDASRGMLPYWFFARRALRVIRDRITLNV